MKAPDARPRPEQTRLRWRDRFGLFLLRGLIRVFERIPLDRAIALGATLGRIWVAVGGPRTRRVREQLAAALPERSEAERETWAREVFVHLGQGLVELLLLSGRQRHALLDRVEIRGLEHLEAAERANPGLGALIVTAHFGNWELAAAKAAAVGIPISVVHRERRSRVLDRALEALREGGIDASAGDAGTLEAIAMGRAGLRVVRALDAGRKVVVLLDQRARRRDGLDVCFFGRPTSTRYGPLALAALRGAPVLPAFMHRLADGNSHLFEIQPALQLELGQADDENVLQRNLQRVTAVIEQEIRASPGQWIWTHRRWRARSDAADPRSPLDGGVG